MACMYCWIMFDILSFIHHFDIYFELWPDEFYENAVFLFDRRIYTVRVGNVPDIFGTDKATTSTCWHCSLH